MVVILLCYKLHCDFLCFVSDMSEVMDRDPWTTQIIRIWWPIWRFWPIECTDPRTDPFQLRPLSLAMRTPG